MEERLASVHDTITILAVVDSANNAARSVGTQINVDSAVGQLVATISLVSPVSAIFTNVAAAHLTIKKIVADIESGKEPEPGDEIAVAGNILGVIGGVAALVPG